MVNKPKTNKEIQASYKARMRASGFRHLAIWVKREYVDKVTAYAKALNEQEKDQ